MRATADLFFLHHYFVKKSPMPIHLPEMNLLSYAAIARNLVLGKDKAGHIRVVRNSKP